MNEDLKYILCIFIEEKVCFEMEIYQLALCYRLFSRTDVKFNQVFKETCSDSRQLCCVVSISSIKNFS